MAALVDTNILVYRYDARFPLKQARAADLLRGGVADRSLVLAHQVLVEFVAVVTRPIGGKPPMLTPDEAYREAEDLLMQFPVLYPTEATLRTALRGGRTLQALRVRCAPMGLCRRTRARYDLVGGF